MTVKGLSEQGLTSNQQPFYLAGHLLNQSLMITQPFTAILWLADQPGSKFQFM